MSARPTFPQLDATAFVPLRYREVDVRDKRGLDVRFFNYGSRGLHLAGFDHLADLEPLMRPESLVRLMRTPDGLVLAAIGEYPAQGRRSFWQWLRGEAKPSQRWILLLSRLSDGTLVLTDSHPAAARRTPPAGVLRAALADHTPPGELANAHNERLRSLLLQKSQLSLQKLDDWQDFQRLEAELDQRRGQRLPQAR